MNWTKTRALAPLLVALLVLVAGCGGTGDSTATEPEGSSPAGDAEDPGLTDTEDNGTLEEPTTNGTEDGNMTVGGEETDTMGNETGGETTDDGMDMNQTEGQETNSTASGENTTTA